MSSQGGSGAPFPRSLTSSLASIEILTADAGARLPERPRRDAVETAAQPVRPPGNRRGPAIREVLAIALIVGVLIAGLGALGGRQRPGLAALPSASVATGSLVPSPTLAVPAGPTPEVAPAVACSDPPANVPAIATLVVDGRERHEGSVSPGYGEQVVIPADAVVTIETQDLRCALAWNIALSSGAILDHQDNPGLDPAFAAQNEFRLQFGAGYRNEKLTAVFRFGDGELRAEWLVYVVPHPVMQILLDDISGSTAAGDTHEVIAAAGCGFSLVLRNGATSSDVCTTSLPSLPIPTLVTQPGATLVFRPADGFLPAELACGHASGSPLAFVVDSTCVLARRTETDPLQFEVPATPGSWVISLGGCSFDLGNRVCGIWFVTVHTVESANP
jgi:hypothetical protein